MFFLVPFYSSWLGNFLCVFQIIRVQISTFQSAKFPVVSQVGLSFHVRAVEVGVCVLCARSVTVSYGGQWPSVGKGISKAMGLLGHLSRVNSCDQMLFPGVSEAWIPGEIDC